MFILCSSDLEGFIVSTCVSKILFVPSIATEISYQILVEREITRKIGTNSTLARLWLKRYDVIMTGIFNHTPMNGKNGLTATPPNVNKFRKKMCRLGCFFFLFCFCETVFKNR